MSESPVHDEFLLGALYVVVHYNDDINDPYYFKVYNEHGEALEEISEDLANKIMQGIIDRDEDRKAEWH